METNLTPNCEADTTAIFEDANDESPRALATVSTIKSIRAIPDADKIVVAEFSTNGWQVIIGKDELKIGDKIIFFEIDAFLPKDPKYAILEGRSNKTFKGQEGYRIRTVRMRGQISQGFAMPLKVFIGNGLCDVYQYQDGDDVTELLGVKLWVAPLMHTGFGFNLGRREGGFPTHLCTKSDQTRLQSMGRKAVLQLMNHYAYEITEKLDGTSGTFIMHRKQEIVYGGTNEVFTYKYYACSRNNAVQRPTDGVKSVYWDVTKRYDIEERLRQYCEENKVSLALQGEICGPGIQGNKYNLSETSFFVYDIFSLDTMRYVDVHARDNIIQTLNAYSTTGDADLVGTADLIKQVPRIGILPIAPTLTEVQAALEEAVESWKNRPESSEDKGLHTETFWHVFQGCVAGMVTKRLVEIADGMSQLYDTPREGLVFKSLVDPNNSHFKVISNKFILKAEKKA